MKPLKIAVGLDDNYVGPLLVMIFSAWKTKQNNFEIIVGYDPSLLSLSNRSFIHEIMRHLEIGVEFLELTIAPEMGSAYHITTSSYIRILLADILEDTFLWLDCDLICECGWDELLYHEVPSENTVICAVIDPLVNKFTQSPNEAIKKANGKYFNAGVAIIDPAAWRRFGFNNRWKDVLLKYDYLKFMYVDQCVLNYLLVKNFSELTPQYNALEMTSRYLKYESVKIRHFAGDVKPWHHLSKIYLTLIGPYRFNSVSRYLTTQNELINHFNGEKKIKNELIKIFAFNRKRQPFFVKLKKSITLRKSLNSLLKNHF
jgi:lipopolysaccharide biosynthesis glycosyltransferase